MLRFFGGVPAAVITFYAFVCLMCRILERPLWSDLFRSYFLELQMAAI
jgi:hypothetical protein